MQGSSPASVFPRAFRWAIYSVLRLEEHVSWLNTYILRKNHTIGGGFLLQCHIWQGFGGRAHFEQAQWQRYALQEQHTAEFYHPLPYALCSLLWLHLLLNQKKALDKRQDGRQGMQ